MDRPQALLPIREVARRTGVNPVTLRAWERRYGLLVPVRSGKGHRLYSEKDLRRVEEILTWLARGVAIGRVRPLLDERGEKPEAGDSWERLVDESAALVEALDGAGLQRQLRQLLAGYPLPLLLDRWLAPLHRLFSRRSRFGSGVAQSLFWQLLAEQLAVSVHAGRKSLRRDGGERLLLASYPGAEQQAFAQLFTAALIAAGFDAVHLGPQVEPGELAYAAEKLQARGVVCYSHNALPMAVFGSGMERGLRSLRLPLWFAGDFVALQRRDLQKFARRENVTLLPADSAAALQQLREQLQ